MEKAAPVEKAAPEAAEARERADDQPPQRLQISAAATPLTTASTSQIHPPAASSFALAASSVGASPAAAIRLQLVVMYMLVAGTALAALVAGHLTLRRLFTRDHQLIRSLRRVPS